MAEYERKSTGISLLRRLVRRSGRTRAKGDKAYVMVTVGELKAAIDDYDLLFDPRRKELKKNNLPYTNKE